MAKDKHTTVKKKRNDYQKITIGTNTSQEQKNKTPRGGISSILSTTVSSTLSISVFRILFFAGTWMFLWFSYYDVLYALQENSLWICAPLSDYIAMELPSDPLTYISRAILTTFAVPWFGSLIVALFLSLIELLADVTLRLGRNLQAVSFIPSFIILFFVCSNDYRLFYSHENSIVFKVILMTAAILLILSLFRLAYSGRDGRRIVQLPVRSVAFNLLTLVIVFISVAMYSEKDNSFRQLTRIQYQISFHKWNRAALLAEQTAEPTRAIAAYHAIAVSQLGQIGDRLFSMNHEYKTVHIMNNNGMEVNEGLLFLPDITYYSGLTLPAYHLSMEQMIICGINKNYIKLMVKTAILNGEHDLASKLLQVVSYIPFEGKFVRKYSAINSGQADLKTDSELSLISNLQPEYDSFEQTFEKPLFLNFYVKRQQGSDQALYLSLAACLYRKNVDGFSSRCGILLENRNIPKYFQQAIVMLGMSQDPEFLKQFKISLDAYNEVKDFFNMYSAHSNDRDKGKAALKSKYGKSYMYYNTYENNPE